MKNCQTSIDNSVSSCSVNAEGAITEKDCESLINHMDKMNKRSQHSLMKLVFGNDTPIDDLSEFKTYIDMKEL